MSTVDLSGWKEDALDKPIPATPAQREKWLKAYHVAVTTRGVPVGDIPKLTSYIQEAAGGGRALVTRFLQALAKGAAAGVVPYGVYDPSKSALAEVGKGFAAASKAATSGLTRVAIIAVVGLAGYLLVTGQIRLPKGAAA